MPRKRVNGAEMNNENQRPHREFDDSEGRKKSPAAKSEAKMCTLCKCGLHSECQKRLPAVGTVRDNSNNTHAERVKEKENEPNAT
jgi:hypothetical protein